jgi:hypothetical protein
VLDGLQYAVTNSHPWAIHSSRVELIFSVSTHVHLCSCPCVMSPDIRRRFLTQNGQPVAVPRVSPVERGPAHGRNELVVSNLARG